MAEKRPDGLFGLFDRFMGEQQRANDLQARLSETEAAWRKSDYENNAAHVKVMAAATRKRQELEARLEKVEAERDEALSAGLAEYAALEEAAAELERRMQIAGGARQEEEAHTVRPYAVNVAARRGEERALSAAISYLRERQAALKGAAPDHGGVAPALRAEADEWPYPDDPPDPL